MVKQLRISEDTQPIFAHNIVRKCRSAVQGGTTRGKWAALVVSVDELNICVYLASK